MANTFATTDLVVRAGLSALKFSTPFIQTTRDYSPRFGQVTASKSTGTAIEVPIPARYNVGGTKGSLDGSYSANNHVETTVNLAIDTYRKIGIPFTSVEQSLSLTDFTNDVVDPAGRSMASVVESDHLKIINKFSNAVLAGTSGVDIDDATNALSVLVENGTPRQNLNLIAPQRMHSSMVNNTSNLFNPQKNISMQYLDGYIGRASGFDWMASELMPIHTNGTATDGVFADGLTPLGTVTAVPANGAVQLQVESIGTDGTITEGTIIQIASVNKVNGYTYESLGTPRQYCVASTATSVAGAVTLTLTEKMIDGSGTNEDKSLQNLDVLPQIGAVVSYVGEVSSSYRQGFAYNRDAVIRAFCKLEMPSAGAKATQKTEAGMIMRALNTFDYDIDSNIFRLDAVSGNAVGRNEYGVRILEKI